MLRNETKDWWADSSVGWYFGGLGATIVIFFYEMASWLYYGVWPHVSILSVLSRINPILADNISAPAHNWVGLHKILMWYLTEDLAVAVLLTSMSVAVFITILSGDWF
jgi:hypothetical protein